MGSPSTISTTTPVRRDPTTTWVPGEIRSGYSAAMTGFLLEAGVDRLALEGQDAEDALVDPVERLAGHEPFEGLDAQGELPQGQGAFVAQPAAAEPAEVPFGGVLGAVDDPQVFAAPTLDPGLDKAPLPPGDDVDRFD